eukprot:856805-Prymnesium_polylepis.1
MVGPSSRLGGAGEAMCWSSDNVGALQSRFVRLKATGGASRSMGFMVMVAKLSTFGRMRPRSSSMNPCSARWENETAVVPGGTSPVSPGSWRGRIEKAHPQVKRTAVLAPKKPIPATWLVKSNARVAPPMTAPLL